MDQATILSPSDDPYYGPLMSAAYDEIMPMPANPIEFETRLTAVLTEIATNPAHWNQRGIHVTLDPDVAKAMFGRPDVCQHCFLAIAECHAFGVPITASHASVYVARPSAFDGCTTFTLARRWLGLSISEGESLFASNNTMDDLRRRVAGLIEARFYHWPVRPQPE